MPEPDSPLLRAWDAADPRGPRLPGADLGCVTLHTGETLIHDRENPDAYIRGVGYDLGREGRPQR